MADVPPGSPADEESESAAQGPTETSPGGTSTGDERREPGGEPPAGSGTNAATRSNGEAPQVVGVDSEAADELLGVLSSATARAVLEALHDEPATASGLANRLDASLQTVHYHLRNLSDAGVVEVTGTTTSEKGREMDLYAPAGGPVVVFASDEDDGDELRDALKRLVGAFGFLALASLLVQEVLGGGVQRLWEASDPSTEDVMVTETAREAAGLEPGLVFFAGGAVVLLVGFAVWYWRWARE